MTRAQPPADATIMDGEMPQLGKWAHQTVPYPVLDSTWELHLQLRFLPWKNLKLAWFSYILFYLQK